MPIKSQITKAEKNEMIRLRRKGLTYEQIAYETGWTHVTVWKICKDGVNKSLKFSRADVARVKAAPYGQLAAIAREVGMSYVYASSLKAGSRTVKTFS